MGSLRVAPHRDGPLWGISSSYFSPALVEHAKAVPGMRFDRPTMSWIGHVDAVAATVARLESKGLRVWGDGDLPQPDAWGDARSPFLFATEGLRDYQTEGVRFLIARSAEGALLADAMRLGKSLQFTVAARAFHQRTLVVCPAHVVGVWARPKNAPEGPGEIAKWWPDAWKEGVVTLEGVAPFKETPEQHAARAKELIGIKVIVCHYDILYAWVEVLKLWGLETFGVDECHILSGYQSRRYDAIKELGKVSKRRMFLTGTPVTNLPKNLHNILEALCPGRFGFFFIPERTDASVQTKKVPPASYAKVFCDSRQKTVGKGETEKVVWDHNGRSNLDEPDGVRALTRAETLNARVAYLMLRRLKKDVDKQLPVKQRQIIDVAIPAKATIMVTPGLFAGGLDGTRKNLRRCLDLAADGKFKSVVELCGDHLAEGEKTICATYRREFTEQVADKVKKKNPDALVEWIHGGIASLKEREKRIHKIRTHEGPAMLVGTIDVISTGIDLSFSGVMVVGELTWDAQDLAQLEERLYAFEAGRGSLIQYVIARGTGDELIVRAIIRKLDDADRVLGATKDGMKEDLGRKKEDPMKRLYEAMKAMQKEGRA